MSIKQGTIPPPLPTGEYICEITRAEPKRTCSGHDALQIRLAVVEPPYGDRIVYDDLVFNRESRERVQTFCSCIGITCPTDGKLMPDMVLGKRVITKICVDSIHAVKQAFVPRDGYLKEKTNPRRKKREREDHVGENALAPSVTEGLRAPAATRGGAGR